MGRRIKKHRKNIPALIPAIHTEETYAQQGQFPLNINDSDRVQWTVEVNREKKIIRISNISYEIKYEDTWIWIVRYDDHGGLGEFHKHERLDIESEIDTFGLVHIEGKQTKEEETQWAIDDLRKNYLEYREKFLTKLGLAIY